MDISDKFIVFHNYIMDVFFRFNFEDHAGMSPFFRTNIGFRHGLQHNIAAERARDERAACQGAGVGGAHSSDGVAAINRDCEAARIGLVPHRPLTRFVISEGQTDPRFLEECLVKEIYGI